MMRMHQLLASVVVVLVLGNVNASAATLDRVRQRGSLACGVNVGLAGFSQADSKGQWKGLDVDVCRAVAAAVLGDATRVTYKGLTTADRFTALQSGQVDVLARNTTLTFLRDTTIELRMVAVNFFDGQAFLVPRDAGVKSLSELAGAKVCMVTGSTHEMNLMDWMEQHKVKFTPVLRRTTEALAAAFQEGRCDAVSSDSSNLASIRATQLSEPSKYAILPERISKEPLGAMVRHDDPQWIDIVRWTMMAMIEAEELGVTSTNVEQLAAWSDNPATQRLLGKTGGYGRLLGLDDKWAQNVIRQVGNYGECFERNVGMSSPLQLERGLNALWTEGGLMYAIPFR